MKTPHIHSEIIKAWADGAEIEYLSHIAEDWWPTDNPEWNKRVEYRVKPVPQPNVVRWLMVTKESGYPEYFKAGSGSRANLKLTFDGETGDIKSIGLL